MKKIWNLFLHNHLFKVLMFAFMALLGSVLIGVFDIDTLFTFILQMTGIAGLGIYALVLIIFAWIINPIRSRREK